MNPPGAGLSPHVHRARPAVGLRPFDFRISDRPRGVQPAWAVGPYPLHKLHKLHKGVSVEPPRIPPTWFFALVMAVGAQELAKARK